MPIPVLPHMIKRQSAVLGMDADELSDIALFRERVEKLVASQRKYQGIPMSRTSCNPTTGVIAFEANTPDVDEVANLALKFRFFYADKEPTQFKKILTKVRRRAQDDWACGYLDWLAMQYKGAMKDAQVSGSLGKAVPNSQIIDLWFNSEFFHSEASKKEQLVDIHTTIGEAPSIFQLYTAIARCSSYVRTLYTVVHALNDRHRFIYTPDYHFQIATHA